MKKMVAAFDGLKFSNSTRDYALYLSRLTEAHLVGVFMDDPTYTSYKIYDLVVKEGATDARIKKFEEKDGLTRQAAAAAFEKACRDAGIVYSLHHDRRIAIQELKHESIYADLMLIDGRETLTHYTEKPPTRFIRDLLTDAQCPVLLTPSRFKPFKKVVLLYDGEPSSVHAIKMFSYLLPELRDLETEVLSVNTGKGGHHLPDNKLMKELMKRHFPSAKFTVLKGNAEEQIIKHLQKAGDQTLVVLGAYRRGTVSRWFRESMADTLMRGLKLPLFIAHNK